VPSNLSRPSPSDVHPCTLEQEKGLQDARRSEGVPTWEELVAEEGRFVYSVAYRLTGNRDDASDLAHDVLLKAREALPRYRPGSLRGWLSRITTNTFYDRVRRLARHQLEPMPDWGDVASSTWLAPEDAALGTELEQVVDTALRTLPPDFRMAVVLCDLHGLKYEEIASVTGWRMGTVRSRIHRGRSALRPLLERYLHGDD
jgi:RNA polymerase sigma-70 factor, ECF subfamily